MKVFLLLCSLVLLSGYSESSLPVKKADNRLSAIKLFNTPGNHSVFIKGTIPSLEKIKAKDFYFSNSFEEWQKGVHPAPKKQYVVTMKGILKFKVSDGSTFIISPGTVLLAEDIQGEGHSWEIVNGNEWIRLYIPMVENNDYFVAE